MKAEEVVILDLRRLSFSFDFFVICTGSSDRRIRAIAEGIEEKLSSLGERPGHLEGRQEGSWLLLDYGSLVAHIFATEIRDFYGLERLWADAPRLRIPKKKN